MIFIDTGAFFARFAKRDQYHRTATEHWKLLDLDGRRCFTSNFVLDEAITLLAWKTTYPFAAARAEQLYRSHVLEIVRPDAVDELDALALFHKYADQRVSFTDCVSFALMDKLSIQQVFTFDQHFQFAGFEVEPASTPVN